MCELTFQEPRNLKLELATGNSFHALYAFAHKLSILLTTGADPE